ncbi:hypothetical protein [Mucilaginibacter straminoryzae]|uniref:hypothetical protein n=1 Tax=Mucilaginibacter straminoryzae TaxID=2932774 RepID=UPI001FD68682|nr:hypothetical protein [Mucilaginibacter straminoryzae]
MIATGYCSDRHRIIFAGSVSPDFLIYTILLFIVRVAGETNERAKKVSLISSFGLNMPVFKIEGIILIAFSIVILI